MQSFALTTADKQLIKTFFITFIAVVAGLPVAAAIMPNRQGAFADPVSGVTKTVSDATDAAGLGSCGTATGTAKKAATTTATHEVVTTRTITQTGNQNQVGTQNSNNDHGATAQANDHSIAAAVGVSDVLSHNNIPVLSNNNTNVSVPVNVPILSGSSSNSGTGNGGLLGLGLLGL